MKMRFTVLLLAIAPIVAVLTACPPVQQTGSGGTGACVSPTTLASSIDTPTTLTAGCYEATSDVQVSAALTLLPGVTIEFAQDTEMDIVTNANSQPTGSLTAVGTSGSGNGIVLRGVNDSPGEWAGVNFYTNNAKNHLEYVEIRDTGDQSYGNGDGIFVASGLPFTMKHSTIDDGMGIGLAFDAGTSAGDLTLQANTYDNLADFPVSLPANAVGALDANSVYTNNAKNAVEVFGGSVGLAQQWAHLAAPYRVDWFVSVDASLAIAAGTTLEFTNGSYIDVNNSSSGTVELTAVGTSTDRINFVGAGNPADTWGGINLNTGSAGDIEYATVRDAGGTGAALNAAINVFSGVPFTLEHAVVDQSAAEGVAFDAGTVLTDLTLQANTYSNNASFPVSVTTDGAGALDPNSQYVNNTDNRVEVFGNSLTHTQTWHHLGAQYYIDGLPTIDAALTIDPATTIQVDPGVTIDVGTGTLTADGGSSSTMITFTTGVAGSTWNGIDFFTANNVLNYVVVDEADSSGSGEVFTRVPGVQISNSTFQNSPDKAICWDVNAQPTTSNLTYISVDSTSTTGCLP